MTKQTKQDPDDIFALDAAVAAFDEQIWQRHKGETYESSCAAA